MCQSCNSPPSSPSTAEPSIVGRKQPASQRLQLHAHSLHICCTLASHPLSFTSSVPCPPRVLPAGQHPRAAGSVGEQKERHGGWTDCFPGPPPPHQPRQRRRRWWCGWKNRRVCLPTLLRHPAAAPTSWHWHGGLGQQASQHAHTGTLPAPGLHRQHAVLEPRVHQKAHAHHQQSRCQEGGLRDVQARPSLHGRQALTSRPPSLRPAYHYQVLGHAGAAGRTVRAVGEANHRQLQPQKFGSRLGADGRQLGLLCPLPKVPLLPGRLHTETHGANQRQEMWVSDWAAGWVTFLSSVPPCVVWLK